MSNEPIGIFDSGLGGLTILNECVKLLPNENFIYFGDTARLPYGDKSPRTIIQYALNSIPFWKEKKIKLLVVACFTASSFAIDALQEKLSTAVFGVIQSAVDRLNHKKIAILGTKSTIKSGVFQNLIQDKNPGAEIFPVACPLFVPLIEEGLGNLGFTRAIAHHYLDPLRKENIDAAYLGCTHYPLIRQLIQEVLGSNVQIIEPAIASSYKIKEWLYANQFNNTQNHVGTREIYVSDDPNQFAKMVGIFFKLKKIRIYETLIGSNPTFLEQI